MSTLTFLCFSTSVYFGGFAAFFLCPRFRCIPLFCMSAVRLISKEPVCPFLWVSPFFKVSTVWDSINNFRPSAHLLFPLAVINISSNPFSLPCPPYRVHYKNRPAIRRIFICHITLKKFFDLCFCLYVISEIREPEVAFRR